MRNELLLPENFHDVGLYPNIKTLSGTILGVPIGVDHKVRDELSTKFINRSNILLTLKHMPATMAVPLIQCCVNERPVFWMRCAPYHQTSAAGSIFDDAVDRCLSSLLALPALPRVSSLVRHLPASLGGLSIRRMEECMHLYVSSLLFSVKRMQKTYPYELRILTSFRKQDVVPEGIENMFTLIIEANPNTYQRYLYNANDVIAPPVHDDDNGARESKEDPNPNGQEEKVNDDDNTITRGFNDLTGLEIPKPSDYFYPV